MIELVFGESAAGGLKMTKSMKQGDCLIEGSPKDVEALTLALDIGDISDIETDIKLTQQAN